MASYYIPSADEFCKGFVYDKKNGNSWEESQFKIDLPFSLLDVRVKYLDESDIIDLGFQPYYSEDNEKCFTKHIACLSIMDYVELVYSVKNGEPFISIYDSNRNTILSEINIKNKFELKWLLNRYGLE